MKKHIIFISILILCISTPFIAANYERVTISEIYARLFLTAKYRQPVIDNVIDPTSVLFKNESFHSLQRKYSFTRVLCGEFNSKNRMGAYTGFAKFIATPDYVYFTDSEAEGDNYTTESHDYKLGIEAMLFESNEYQVLRDKHSLDIKNLSSVDEYNLLLEEYKKNEFLIRWRLYCENA